MLLITGRPWRQIARELATEHDPYRIIDLCEELTAAVAEQRSVPASARGREFAHDQAERRKESAA